MKLHLWLCGVRLGSRVRFYGRTKFVLSKSARVFIGDEVVFRSSRFSNLIGINRPCIVSVLGQDANLSIQAGAGFSGTVIGCFHEIQIHARVRCGANTLITDSDWHLNDPRATTPRPIVIEENVWLGVNVSVLKGVRIGRNSVIGANSVVTKDIPSNVIAAGNPCRVIKALQQNAISKLDEGGHTH